MQVNNNYMPIKSINLRIRSMLNYNMVHYYIKKIKCISHKPTTCMICNSQNIIEDAVLASTGPTQENTDYTPSMLCIECETLMIITTEPGAGLGLQASIGNEVSMRN